MLSQAICASRRVSPCRSTLLYQHFTKTRLVTTVAEDNQENQIQKPPLRTAYLRTWEPLKNVGDAYVLLRALERKYGKVLEARFAKVGAGYMVLFLRTRSSIKRNNRIMKTLQNTK